MNLFTKLSTLAAFAGAAALGTSGIASAQEQPQGPPPSGPSEQMQGPPQQMQGPPPQQMQGPMPSYASGEEEIHGRISQIAGKYQIFVRDERGFVDNVSLHDGTIINPTGLTLNPGQAVSILGHTDGKTFTANEIDTPYQYAGFGPGPYYGAYYGPYYGGPYFGARFGWGGGRYYGWGGRYYGWGGARFGARFSGRF